VTQCISNLKFGEMEFCEMKLNMSNWSNFCMLLRRGGLSASASTVLADFRIFSNILFTAK